MKNIHKDFIYDEDLVQYIAKDDKFKSRYEAIYTDMEVFLRAFGYDEQASVNELILEYVLVDYFVDVQRLKTFHRLDHINSYKVVAYTAYWLLKRRPIQLLVANEKTLIDINEKFVLAYILDFLSTVEGESLAVNDTDSIQAYKESLLYYLKFRCDSAASLEMILLAFQAGQVYMSPEIGEDEKLAKYK